MDDRDLQEAIWQTPWILQKIRTREDYAQNLYAAFCNMQWCKRDPNNVWPILKEEYWSASWRGAGGLVASWRGEGDYMNWYCSGMGGFATYDEKEGEDYMSSKKYVPEGTVTDEIAADLDSLGWFPIPYKDEDLGP
jgi:hypothetical protein